VGKIKTYRDLIVWQKAMALVTDTYRISRDFPREEMYGLTAHIRKSAVSVPSNIAEGCGRKSTLEYIRFLQIAMGSLFEFQTQLEISLNLKYISSKVFNRVIEESREIERMLSALIAKLNTKSKKGRR